MNIREDLKAFVDGELSPTRMDEMRAAVEADPALQQEVNLMRALGIEIKRAAKEAPVPTEGVDRLKSKSRRPWYRRPIYAAACAASIVLACIVIFPVFAQSKDAAKETAAISSTASELSDKAKDSPSYPPDADVQDRAANAKMPADGGLSKKDGSRFEDQNMTLNGSPNSSSLTIPPSDRQVIRTADMGVKVEDVTKAQGSASTIAASVGGFVETSGLTRDQNNNPTSSLTMRVPARQFDPVMVRLRALGEVTNEQISGQDVTTQIADTTARLKVMRAEEDSYITMLKAARRVGDLLSIKERLSQVREQIESLTAQEKTLTSQAAMSTITVAFEQKPQIGEPKKESSWSDDIWTSAVNGLASAGRFLGGVLIVLFVYAPIWIPIALVTWWLIRRGNRS